MKQEMMRLKLLLPAEKLLDVTVAKVIAEAENGSFCLLPHHVDFVASLPPGIFFFVTEEGDEEYLALDEGILVKVGSEVRVSASNAVRGASLGELRETLERQFRMLDERQRSARSAVARLEAGFVGKFLDLQESSRL
jgi:F-type H+-transporting ATPase subunit epsilon